MGQGVGVGRLVSKTLQMRVCCFGHLGREDPYVYSACTLQLLCLRNILDEREKMKHIFSLRHLLCGTFDCKINSFVQGSVAHVWCAHTQSRTVY